MGNNLGFYEQFPYPLNHSHGRKFRQYLSRLLEEIFSSRARPKNILDAGCGTGAVTSLLTQLLPQTQIVGVDQSARSIQLAEKLCLPNAEFRRGDLCNGLGWDRQFDFVFCHGVLHHMDRVEAALQTLIRSLANDGVLYIWLYSQHGRIEIELIRKIEKILSVNHEDIGIRIELFRAIRKYFPELSHTENQIISEQDDQFKGDAVNPDEEVRFISDRYLNPIARHFSVTEAAELFTSCGLKLESIPQFDWLAIDEDLNALEQVRREDSLKYYEVCEMLCRPSGIGYILQV